MYNSLWLPKKSFFSAFSRKNRKLFKWMAKKIASSKWENVHKCMENEKFENDLRWNLFAYQTQHNPQCKLLSSLVYPQTAWLFLD